MGLTLSAPIATSRGILNDPDGVRYSDADLLQYANDALDQMAILVPQEFTENIFHFLTAYQHEQELSAATSVAFVGVVNDGVGAPVTQADLSTLDLFDPGWRTRISGAGRPKHWAPVVGRPRVFAVYPIAPLGTTGIWVRHVAKPGEYAAAADTGVSERFSDAISDYIVYRACLREDETSDRRLADMALNSFIQKVKGSAK